MSGTASDKEREVEFPGWYITFQTAVLQQLPRPGDGKGGTLDQFTVEAWVGNQKAMKAALATFTQTMPYYVDHGKVNSRQPCFERNKYGHIVLSITGLDLTGEQEIK